MITVEYKIIFIVGLGASGDLYKDYLANLKKYLPENKVLVLEWWNIDDFGMEAIHSFMGNSNVILISHSAGSVIAFQALNKWPHQIKKMIMLDSHFLRTTHTLSSVSQMLEIILKHDSISVNDKVRIAYAPVLVDDSFFKNALNSAIVWVNASFDNACSKLITLPVHSVLFIGFTNSAYQPLEENDQKQLLAFWEQWNVDVKFFSITHFGFIEAIQADVINESIVEWIHLK